MVNQGGALAQLAEFLHLFPRLLADDRIVVVFNGHKKSTYLGIDAFQKTGLSFYCASDQLSSSHSIKFSDLIPS